MTPVGAEKQSAVGWPCAQPKSVRFVTEARRGDTDGQALSPGRPETSVFSGDLRRSHVAVCARCWEVTGVDWADHASFTEPRVWVGRKDYTVFKGREEGVS